MGFLAESKYIAIKRLSVKIQQKQRKPQISKKIVMVEVSVGK